jgi:hypothetical protein
MGNVTIEFYGSEYGVGFPLSYIIPWEVWQESLMTLKGYAYEKGFVSELVAETNRYSWGMVDAASHFTALQLTASKKSI